MSIFPCGSALHGTAVVLVLATAPTFATASPADTDVAFWVKSALTDDPHVDATHIAVTAEKGIVTLSGRAPNLATKRYAVQEAEKIKGVAGVIDRLDLAEIRYPDFDIAQNIRHRLINNEMIATSWISPVCSEGTVTLTGEVGSWAQMQEAGIVAGEVCGVREVINDLRIRPPRTASDEDIRKDAEARLDLDNYLNGLPITVSVKNGVVRLFGTVGSKFEKDRAEREVRYLSHVKGVTNDLKVDWWENKGARTSPPTLPSDTVLEERVTSMLERDGRVNAAKIDVAAREGHVALRGSVPFMYEKRIAEKDARNTIGVAWVTNELLVSGVNREDDSILTDILANFGSDWLLDGIDITTSVHNGTVTLRGDVRTQWERQHAEEIVARVPGVSKIENHIEIDANVLSAAAATKHVEDRLSWNWITAPVCGNIHVAVEDGVATLTGEVDTWAERIEAAQIAIHTPGIWGVHDGLAVRGVPYPWDSWQEEEILVRER